MLYIHACLKSWIDTGRSCQKKTPKPPRKSRPICLVIWHVENLDCILNPLLVVDQWVSTFCFGNCRNSLAAQWYCFLNDMILRQDFARLLSPLYEKDMLEHFSSSLALFQSLACFYLSGKQGFKLESYAYNLPWLALKYSVGYFLFLSAWQIESSYFWSLLNQKASKISSRKMIMKK